MKDNDTFTERFADRLNPIDFALPMNKDIDEEQAVESRSRSFIDFWKVAADYEIKNGFIIPVIVNKTVNWYLPMGRPELPGEFAKLAAGIEKDVLQFVKRYGLLGYKRAFRFPYEVISADQLGTYNDKAPGDPLHWIISHAKAVDLIMHLAGLINKPQHLKDFIGSLTVKINGSPCISYAVPERGNDFPAQALMSLEYGERTAAIEIIRGIINKNIEGITRKIIIKENKLVSIFSFNNLLECIYWLIADAVTAAKIKTCEYCGKPFIAPDDKTKYCPPLQWEKVSRCMNRAKQSRLRKKRKKK